MSHREPAGHPDDWTEQDWAEHRKCVTPSNFLLFEADSDLRASVDNALLGLVDEQESLVVRRGRTLVLAMAGSAFVGGVVGFMIGGEGP